jgi:putative SOS response-associated peptidase YedK
MCGRYTLTNPLEAIREKGLAADAAARSLGPLFNIAPTHTVPVVLNTAPGRVTLARWGLVPRWADDPSIGNRMINARAESVTEKPTFRKLFERQRCLVLADGFYEWQKTGKRKVPYRAALRSGAPFSFAGLWEAWKPPSSAQPLITFTIITTSANALLKPIHDRMPVMLDASGEKSWLQDAVAPSAARALLKPYRGSQLAVHEVSRAVNSPLNNSPEVLHPA